LNLLVIKYNHYRVITVSTANRAGNTETDFLCPNDERN